MDDVSRGFYAKMVTLTKFTATSTQVAIRLSLECCEPVEVVSRDMGARSGTNTFHNLPLLTSTLGRQSSWFSANFRSILAQFEQKCELVKYSDQVLVSILIFLSSRSIATFEGGF